MPGAARSPLPTPTAPSSPHTQVYNSYRFGFDRLYGPDSAQDEVYLQSARSAVLNVMQVCGGGIWVGGGVGVGGAIFCSSQQGARMQQQRSELSPYPPSLPPPYFPLHCLPPNSTAGL